MSYKKLDFSYALMKTKPIFAFFITILLWIKKEEPQETPMEWLYEQHKDNYKLDVFWEKRMSPPPPRVPPCALLKEGKERDMTVLKRNRFLR